MGVIEKYVEQQLAVLVPAYEILEVSISVNDTSYSVGFFATVDGKRMQYMEMVDDGLIRESALEEASENIFHYIKSTVDYRSGEINKFSFIFSK